MKTISLSELIALLALPDWQHEQIHSISSKDDDAIIGVAKHIAKLDDVEIRYVEEFYCDLVDTNMPLVDEENAYWLIEGLTIMGQNGIPLESTELNSYFPQHFSELDYSFL